MKNNLKILGLFVFPVLLALTGCGKEDNPLLSGDDTIRDISAIANTADRRELVGKKVDIQDAKVQSVVGNFIFWAGEPHTAVPVARVDKMNGPVNDHVRSGDKVRLVGVVRLLETVEADDKFWESVNEDEKKDILGARIYIAADNVIILP